ncbi:class I SAM-dependent methyltransferase [Streptomyces soliscabiei]|uniref:class I SAM-dependent methyltransferase n=1 Tax=Streptomyces soliscabiei TaxID=588897 RepID=UPI0029B8A6B9|nr:class I SAM-dependent methyltransferase [Streptomyces sp. NY05-11A]MDX2676397.1 class I SAM-dependent methyltransferase [Streptomyces sp. NY05-11A]
MSRAASGGQPALAERAETTAPPRSPHPVLPSTWPPAATRPADNLAAVEPGTPWADDPYARALRAGHGPLFLRRLSDPDRPGQGELLPLDVERWCAAADAVDLAVLRRCTGPVMDVGCGPGRLVAELAARGMPALGVDLSPAAVSRTRRRGGSAVRRSVFARLPREGRWTTLLLMDGNIGIGGDPVALLTRLHRLAAPGGRLLAEAAPDDVDERLTVRVEDGHGRHGRPFPWARVGVTALLRASDAAGWILTGRWTADGRPFVELHRPKPPYDAPDPTAPGGPAPA